MTWLCATLQRLSLLSGRGRFVEMNDCAAEALHSGGEGEARASAHFEEHRRHHFTLKEGADCLPNCEIGFCWSE